jgi:hypothetical protein
MQEIYASGSEGGYHYEEIAQYCKDNNIHGWGQVLTHMPAIQAKFVENFTSLEDKLGFKIKSVVSHGDFVNRILKHSNYELLTPEIREQLGVELEGYDPVLVDSYNYIQSDKPYPQFYREQQTPDEAVNSGVPVVYIHTHPRYWHGSVWINLKDNMLRLKEGNRYKQ